MSKALLVILPFLLLACASPSQEAGSQPETFNALTLAALREMPSGGAYSGTDATKNKLVLACRAEGADLVFTPSAARPSFCSGATYLVFLRAAEEAGVLTPAVAQALVVQPDQQDGHGVFGRWNANGPGCAKLIADLGAGMNFTSWEEARPGDFLKIWWTEAIGGRERGHHVVYLGHDAHSVRFWSSNQPAGYGEKTIPREQCRRLLFTRLTQPARLQQVTRLPATDEWLARMLREDFTWQEVVEKCHVQRVAN
ncbi:hypothetical protein [Roseibacillus ishigakijimensis]|uniref:Lipoprotein n=1 Tax=Roseibacillus ishigakijimensis TaxID=454146 RepID=A0A934RPP6_9BACT|nr:hypothetical protein [Roseibacillus ishigakijimensis]MBK1833562.1 hypothetical protein [Roseibacillus ishigakijimensis]